MKTIGSTIILVFICTFQIAIAQEVQVSVSYDTVYAGNVLGVRYTMENWQGDMKSPDFGVFEVVGGPQITSSMSFSEGRRQSSKSITFYLKPPEEEGHCILPALKFAGEGKEVITAEKTIIVIDNPDGIQQNPEIEKKESRLFDKQYKRRQEPDRGQRQRF